LCGLRSVNVGNRKEHMTTTYIKVRVSIIRVHVSKSVKSPDTRGIESEREVFRFFFFVRAGVFWQY